MDQTRGDDGKFIENTTTDEVLELLETANEPLTAVEVADRLNISTFATTHVCRRTLKRTI